jgi:hypothetical protein
MNYSEQHSYDSSMTCDYCGITEEAGKDGLCQVRIKMRSLQTAPLPDNERKWTTQDVFNMLTYQAFADFYSDNGAFGKWITGDDDAPRKEDVEELLKKLLARK